jgi:hypothetical protein
MLRVDTKNIALCLPRELRLWVEIPLADEIYEMSFSPKRANHAMSCAALQSSS